MSLLEFSDFETDTKTPKYRQVMDIIKSDIEHGIFKRGERIPSINETSEEFYLSRDTVEKAYNRLRELGIIVSVPGKGYYVNCDHPTDKLRVLLIINKISAHKKQIVNAFVDRLGEEAIVETVVHNYSTDALERIINENLGNYSYYAIIPCFTDFSEKTRKIIDSIPKDKLVLIDKDVSGLGGEYKAISEDFEHDTYNALQSGIDLLKKYKRINFIFPDGNQYQPGLITGFKKFCVEYSFEYCVTNVFNPDYMQPKEVYIVIEESDLADVIKAARNKGYKIGKDIGVLSYNDTPLKEILEDGISVISTDFKKMGETAAELILEKRNEKIHNSFYLIRRHSL
jgi:DNA-binding transcriptional regulator YhcF (GntR family)